MSRANHRLDAFSDANPDPVEKVLTGAGGGGVIAEQRPDPRVQTLDVLMLAVTGGRERSPDQLENLLESTDLRLTGIIETTGPMSILEEINT